MSELFDQPNAIAVQPSKEPSLLAIIERASMDAEFDVGKLQQLIELKERVERMDAEKAFASAMNACQAKMPTVVRWKKNAGTNTKYVPLETLHEVTKPIYIPHGFSLSFGTVDSPIPNYVREVCDCTHIAGHTRRYHVDLPPDDVGMKGTQNKTPIQAVGSTLSYGRRYLEVLIWNITIADEDNDGQRSTATITDAQAMEIEAFINERGINAPRVLKWLQVERVVDIPARRHDEVWRMLNAKSVEIAKAKGT